MKWLHGRIRDFVDNALYENLGFRVSLGLFFGALFIYTLATILGSASIEYAGREVGYGNALNWSIVLGVLTPVLLAVTRLTTRALDSLLKHAAESGSIVDSKGAQISVQTWNNRWKAFREGTANVGVFIVYYSVLAGLAEFWDSSLGPVLTDKPIRYHDWFAASLLIEDGHVKQSTAANLIFCAFAFAGFSCALAVGYIFAWSMIRAGWLLWSLSSHRADFDHGSLSFQRPQLPIVRTALLRDLRILQFSGTASGLVAHGIAYLVVLYPQYINNSELPNMLDATLPRMEDTVGASAMWFVSRPRLDHAVVAGLAWGTLNILIVWIGFLLLALPSAARKLSAADDILPEARIRRVVAGALVFSLLFYRTIPIMLAIAGVAWLNEFRRLFDKGADK